jgi:hypothetical protein
MPDTIEKFLWYQSVTQKRPHIWRIVRGGGGPLLFETLWLAAYRAWEVAGAWCLLDAGGSHCLRVLLRLRGPEMVTWQLRLLVDAGVVAPCPVQARALPADAPMSVQKVYRGFMHLLACKWLYTAAAPTPYSWRFAAAWCGMHSLQQIGAAMEWLLKRGYVRRVGTHKRMALFLPGRPSRRMANSAR